MIKLITITLLFLVWSIVVFYMLYSVASAMLGDWAGYLVLILAMIVISSILRLAIESRD